MHTALRGHVDHQHSREPDRPGEGWLTSQIMAAYQHVDSLVLRIAIEIERSRQLEPGVHTLNIRTIANRHGVQARNVCQILSTLRGQGMIDYELMPICDVAHLGPGIGNPPTIYAVVAADVTDPSRLGKWISVLFDDRIGVEHDTAGNDAVGRVLRHNANGATRPPAIDQEQPEPEAATA